MNNQGNIVDQDFLNLYEQMSNNLTPRNNSEKEYNNPFQQQNLEQDNWQQEVFRRNYPNYASKINVIPPPEFSLPSRLETQKVNQPDPADFDKIRSSLDIIAEDKKIKSECSDLNLLNWLRSHSIVSGNYVQNVDYILTKLKDYSLKSKSTICEVKKIDVVDCCQILTVVDIFKKAIKLILIKDEQEILKNSNENLKLIINDYFFKKGDILLCNLQNKEIQENQYIILNLKEVQILN